MEAKIKAIAPWFGGKRTLADTIVEAIGPHRAYWGICCGSLAVEFAKPAATMETCIDLHGDLTNLAFVLQDESLASDLYGRASRMLLSRELFLKSAQVIRSELPPSGDDPPNVDRAFHYLIVSWFGRNGVAGTSNYNAGFCMRYTKNGGHAAKRFVSAIESIPAWHERLRNITIIRDDIFKHLHRIEDSKGVAIYVDPPYIVKGAKYLHDFQPDDHQRLAAELLRFQQTKVVVSYYAHEQLSELYPDWKITPVHAVKALVNQGMRDRGKATIAPEVLLTNL